VAAIRRRLLVIERSRTLRHTLRQLFATAGNDSIEYELDVVDGFALARRRLAAAGAAYDGVVLGWPLASSASSDEVQLMLGEVPFASTFCLVLTHEAEAGARTWVGERPNTAYMLWDSQDKIVDTVEAGLREQTTLVPGDGSISGIKALRFLLVDDSASARVFFRRLLSTRGYEVDTAASVGEAREKLRVRRFDVAIIDFYLPEMRGDDLVREIKTNEKTSDVTCAVITGAYSDQIIRQCLQAGAVECLFKNEAGELLLSQVDAIARTVRDSLALYEKEQLLEGILGSVGEGVYGVDDENRITFINSVGLQMLGFSDVDELRGHNAEDLFHENVPTASKASIAWMRMAYAARGYLKPVAKTMKKRDGSKLNVTASVYPLRVRNEEMGTVIAFREVAHSRGLENQAWWHATHDAETGVLNQRYFEVQVEAELQQSRRAGSHHAVLMVGLHDDHAPDRSNGAGKVSMAPLSVSDRALGCVKHVADLLEDRARASDLVAYFGNGRFALLLRDADPDFASSIQSNYRSLLESVIEGQDGIAVGVGIAVMDKSIHSPNEIIALASLAQQIASRRGIPGVQFEVAGESEVPA